MILFSVYKHRQNNKFKLLTIQREKTLLNETAFHSNIKKENVSLIEVGLLKWVQ